jgi:hypothetical protein
LVIPERIRIFLKTVYRMLPKATAITGAIKSGRKKELPKTAKFTWVPTAIKPAPTRAPVKLCVVDMGKPVTVAIITVIAEPIATAVRNSGEIETASGTRPLPEKVFTSVCAKNTEHTEPANVVTVASQMAPL